MREIKFRAKRLDNGEWISGDLHLHTPFPHIHSTRGDKAKIDTDTIGQFTGLHDKNGKEIYEGDIYRYEHPDSLNEVSYCMGGGFAGFDFSPAFHDGHQLTNVEVVGNIHSNPELLKSL